jgi:hypothetical protein
MEKRSRRRTRDLVTQAASKGLSENEIGCARISMMARSINAPCKGRIQMRKTTPSIYSHSACTARPVHPVGSFASILACPLRGVNSELLCVSAHCAGLGEVQLWLARDLLKEVRHSP